MDHEPKGEWARYAFGYSDTKPGWAHWLVLVAGAAFVAWRVFAP